jgi:hypothetical protein
MDQFDANQKTSLPPDAPSPQETDPAAEEDARMGLIDHSVAIGAEVETDADLQMAEDAPTAGDPDAMPYQAQVVGEEAIGGTTPTPDQSDVDDIGHAVGFNPQAEHPVNVMGTMRKRDEHRYELDPESKGPGDSA